MGPYSEIKQAQRKAAIKKVLKNKKLHEDMRIIWTRHLNNLSVNEEEYNIKVKSIYEKLSSWNTIT